jgi:hypothetical protein
VLEMISTGIQEGQKSVKYRILSPRIHHDPLFGGLLPGIMETRWCARENRSDDFGKGKSLALLPCKGPACDDWEDGPVTYCIHLVRYDKGRTL